ncbi:MAG: cyclic nucleotide-binding domain-containing protein [Proteobacteria bacterium]|nr:cyclic nucleotide-binding domain-containing protein [Pseudomonadota bacterium]
MAEKYAIAIVGSGPGGASAGARAAQRGTSHVLLERTDHLSDTIYKYQKRKLVMATPDVLPLRSDLGFKEGARETVLETWDKGVGQAKSNVRYNAEVTAITGEKGDFTLTLASGDSVQAEAVVLAIGLQGNLRKLGVPGSEAPFVQYQLDDPDAYTDEDIVVIGGGDAGIENALALSANNNVSIVNNQAEFAYAKPANAAAIQDKIRKGEVQGIMSAQAKLVEADGFITLTQPEGEVRVHCDRIIARIGALPPRKFVESCGIQFPSPAPNAFPQVSERYESNVPGIYIIGALAGYPLIKQCLNQGYEVVEFILGNAIAPADEPLIQTKLDKLPSKLAVSDLLSLIRERLPIYGALTTLQVRDFLISANVHELKAGDIVFRRNDYTNSFFSVLDGEVDIQVNLADPKEVVTLQTGQFFGEMGLISGRRRTATVVARTNCLLLEVPRNTMIRLQRSIPEVKRVIDEVAIVRQIRMYLAPQVDEALLGEVVAKSSVVAYKQNDVLIEEGATDDAVYLIRTGSVTVSRKLNGKEIVLSYIAAGNYVGEMSLLMHTPRSATVKASVATEVIKIDSASFRTMLEREPELKQQVEASLASRLMERARREARQETSGLMQFLMEQGLGEATDVLLIDESLCVRCDNCEKACAETHHGVSRLNREAGPTFATMHVPTSCRHCEHPHCMKDCPPDAIHRAQTGEVFITEACIGCGNCERNCPYGVIQMAANPEKKPSLMSWLMFGRGYGPGEDKTPEGMSRRTGSKHAVKCDMCKGDPSGPACVRACPTGAALRVSPEKFLPLMRDGSM